MARCKGQLFLENIGGLLVRRDKLIHGYCSACGEWVALRYARRLCNRMGRKAA